MILDFRLNPYATYYDLEYGAACKVGCGYQIKNKLCSMIVNIEYSFGSEDNILPSIFEVWFSERIT